MIPWTVAVEGDSDTAVVAAILRSCGHELGTVHVRNGKASLDARLRGFLNAAAFNPWLVLRDLDQDADCAPSLLSKLLPGPTQERHPLRIAVRKVEAWLLADDETASKWLGVARSLIPRDVEGLMDPKASLIELARRSRSRTIHDDMVPIGSARIGPGYVNQIRAYCGREWRPDVAAARAPSLARCLQHVRNRTVGQRPAP